MKAVILASGMGRRLAGESDGGPKCLVRVHGEESILDMQLAAFAQHGIREVAITTGYGRDRLVDHLGRRHSALRCHLVHNEQYESTNYIVSLHLCRDYVDDDILLVHGDLVFDADIIPRLVAIEESAVVTKEKGTGEIKDFTAVIHQGGITRIAVGCEGPDVFPVDPLYKLRQGDATVWLDRIAGFVAAGKTTCYAEDALNEVLQEFRLVPSFCKESLCQEIDTPEDLVRVRDQLSGL